MKARRTMRDRLADMRPIAGGSDTATLDAPASEFTIHMSDGTRLEFRNGQRVAPTAELAEGDEGDDPEVTPEPDGEVEGNPNAVAIPERWEGTIILEGLRTDDGRQIKEGGLGWRGLPLPFMFQPATNPGHGQSRLAGSIESIERRDGGIIWGEGRFDLDGVDGKEAARLVGEGFLRWVSADVAVTEWETIIEGDCDLEDVLWGGGDEDCTITDQVNEGKIMGCTLVAFPAFEEAEIAGVSGEAVTAAVQERTEDDLPLIHTQPLPMDGSPVAEVLAPVVAAAGPLEPPAEWFADPCLPMLTPLTITNEGRIFGHLAPWGVCHIGHMGQCVEAPKSASDYAYFRTGAIRAAGSEAGDVIPCGVLTLGTGHASTDPSVSAADAIAHYDNTGTAVADIVTGEDEFGVWFSGAVRPGVTKEQERALYAAPPSGDWRPIAGQLELVALLAVNVGGYPVPRVAARVASGGEVTALVASLGPRADTPKARAGRIDRLEAAVKAHGALLRTLRPVIAETLRHRVLGNEPSGE